MDEKVKVYLDKKREEIREEKQKRRAAELHALGLYEKIYSPDNTRSAEYPLSEWNEKAKQLLYYREEALDVSDEELEEIKQLNKPISLNPDQNAVATALSIIACIIFIGGFIAGIGLGYVEVEGYYSSYTEFSFKAALIYWAASFISGMLFLGFAEIIQLLTAIKNK